MNKYKFLMAALILTVLLAACTLTPASSPTPTPEIPQAAPTEPGPEETPPIETVTSSTDLPATLFFLGAGENGLTQVFRISQDRTSATQITAEPEEVEGYAVNPVSGQVAYLTNNQIFLINADTTGRTLLVDGSEYIAETDEYFFRQIISGLSWSNDGTILAYGQNGLNLLTLANNTSEKIIENELDIRENNFIFPMAIYTPLNWSPDGSLMMVDIGFYEGGTIGIFSPETGEVNRLGEGIVCCHPTWSPDSRSIVVASPYMGMVPSGLWRYDVQTGASQELITSDFEKNILTFAGWPLVLDDGSLQFFFSSLNDFPPSDVPMAMVRSDADGVTNRTIIRIEEWQLYDVLWAPDGRLAVAVIPQPGEAPGWPRIGPVVLIPASADAVIPLGMNGYDLQWGP